MEKRLKISELFGIAVVHLVGSFFAEAQIEFFFFVVLVVVVVACYRDNALTNTNTKIRKIITGWFQYLPWRLVAGAKI
jgi:hypothetical protein